jgi:hypothetical protein
MSAQPSPANFPTEPGQHAPAQDTPAQDAADAHYYRHALHDLIDMGTDLARLLHQQATAQAAQQTTAQAAPQHPAPQPAPDAHTPDALVSIAAAFDRIARAVRRSIALARSLADPIPTARDPAQHRAAARKRILREVEDTIQRTAPGSDAADLDDASADALTAELHDRLDAPDLDDDISHRPVADIITEICRDLGLAALSGAHPWKRRTPNDLEQLRARAAAPSSTRQINAAPLVPVPIQRAATSPVPPGPAAFPRATGPHPRRQRPAGRPG